MPRRPRTLRVFLVAILALLSAVSATLGPAREAAAYWPFDYLDGLDQVVTRTYSRTTGDEAVIGVEIEATIARFDSAEAAQVGYDDVTAQYGMGYASIVPDATPVASEVAGLGDASTAYTSVAHFEMLLEWYLDHTAIVTRDGADLIIVSAELQVAEAPESPASTDLARDLTSAIIGATAGEGEPVANADGTFSGGIWERLPTLDHEALRAYAVDSMWDRVDFPEPASADEATPETGDEADGELDFSTLEGARRAVAREYSGDMTALQTPESAPPGIYFLAAIVAEFDSDDHAASALDTIAAELRASYEEDDTYTMRELDPAEFGDLGDQVMGQLGTGEAEGVPLELTLLVVRDGAWVYVAGAVGVGAESGTADAAAGIVRAMADADAGEGDGTFDEAGGSTGGAWDKLPADGDPALQGLTAESDTVIYPEPEGGS